MDSFNSWKSQKKLKIGSGFEDVDCSPVAYAELKDRINGLLDTVE